MDTPNLNFLQRATDQTAPSLPPLLVHYFTSAFGFDDIHSCGCVNSFISHSRQH
ncbi:hypothetical protein BFJ71_g7213 [Fusarium oxysporum]|nr:hypothetical protein BFJ71_g7213 [Fusarium oxysporum]